MVKLVAGEGRTKQIGKKYGELDELVVVCLCYVNMTLPKAKKTYILDQQNLPGICVKHHYDNVHLM